MTRVKRTQMSPLQLELGVSAVGRLTQSPGRGRSASAAAPSLEAAGTPAPRPGDSVSRLDLAEPLRVRGVELHHAGTSRYEVLGQERKFHG